MADIYHDFPINALAHRVFEAVSISAGLDQWWTKRSSGEPRLGANYELWFGPEYDWRARVTKCEPAARFELQVTQAGSDWIGTRVGFELDAGATGTKVRFFHPSL